VVKPSDLLDWWVTSDGADLVPRQGAEAAEQAFPATYVEPGARLVEQQ